MSTSEIHVPEGVQAAFDDAMLPAHRGPCADLALERALQQLVEDLLGDGTRASAGYGAFKDRYPADPWPAKHSAVRMSWEGHAAAAVEAALQHVLGGSE